MRANIEQAHVRLSTSTSTSTTTANGDPRRHHHLNNTTSVTPDSHTTTTTTNTASTNNHQELESKTRTEGRGKDRWEKRQGDGDGARDATRLEPLVRFFLFFWTTTYRSFFLQLGQPDNNYYHHLWRPQRRYRAQTTRYASFGSRRLRALENL